MDNKKVLLSQSEFARRIGTTYPTLQRWISLGYVKPYMKTPTGKNKFTEKQVEEYFDKFKVEDNED